jgi:hypothetical protein
VSGHIEGESKTTTIGVLIRREREFQLISNRYTGEIVGDVSLEQDSNGYPTGGIAVLRIDEENFPSGVVISYFNSNLVSGLAYEINAGGAYRGPTITSFDADSLTFATITGDVARIKITEGNLMTLIEFVTPLVDPDIELMIPQVTAEEVFLGAINRNELGTSQIRIDGALYRLPIYGGYVDGTDSPDGKKHVFIMVDKIPAEAGWHNNYTVYALDYTTFKTTVLIDDVTQWLKENSDLVNLYDFQIKVAPDASSLMLVTHQDGGVGIWYVDLTTETPQLTPLDKWKFPIYEYDVTPWDISSDKTGVTVETYSGAPVPHYFYRGDIRTYTWEGERIKSYSKYEGDAYDPAFYLRGDVLYGDDSREADSGEVVISDGVTGQRYTEYFGSNQGWDNNTWGGMVVGYLDDGTQNFTIGFPSYRDSVFSVENIVYRGAVLGDIESCYGNLFHQGIDNYVWVVIMPDIDPESATVYYLEGDTAFPIVTGLAYQRAVDGSYTFPTLSGLYEGKIIATTLDGVATTYDIRELRP